MVYVVWRAERVFIIETRGGEGPLNEATHDVELGQVRLMICVRGCDAGQVVIAGRSQDAPIPHPERKHEEN